MKVFDNSLLSFPAGAFCRYAWVDGWISVGYFEMSSVKKIKKYLIPLSFKYVLISVLLRP